MVGLWEGGLLHGPPQRTLQLWVLLLLSTPQLLLLTAVRAGRQS